MACQSVWGYFMPEGWGIKKKKRIGCLFATWAIWKIWLGLNHMGINQSLDQTEPLTIHLTQAMAKVECCMSINHLRIQVTDHSVIRSPSPSNPLGVSYSSAELQLPYSTFPINKTLDCGISLSLPLLFTLLKVSVTYSLGYHSEKLMELSLSLPICT